MWEQLVTPNLNPVIVENGKVLKDWLGWCLAYVKTGFSAYGNTGDTAWKAWGNTQLPHTDAVPTGVYFPVWFDGYKGMGHVVICKDGKCWSSPLSHKASPDVFNSIAEVEKAYGVKYVGWSEDIANRKVIERGNQVSTVGDNEIDQMSWAYFGYGAGQDFITEHRGTESNTFERFMFNHPVAVAYRAQVAQWRSTAEASQGKFQPVTEQLYKKG